MGTAQEDEIASEKIYDPEDRGSRFSETSDLSVKAAQA
jgi:hypothetical protein